jgi:hypothetical protein
VKTNPIFWGWFVVLDFESHLTSVATIIFGCRLGWTCRGRVRLVAVLFGHALSEVLAIGWGLRLFHTRACGLGQLTKEGLGITGRRNDGGPERKEEQKPGDC